MGSSESVEVRHRGQHGANVGAIDQEAEHDRGAIRQIGRLPGRQLVD